MKDKIYRVSKENPSIKNSPITFWFNDPYYRVKTKYPLWEAEPDMPYILDSNVSFVIDFARKFYSEGSEQEVGLLVNPPKLSNSGGAWEDIDFINELFEKFFYNFEKMKIFGIHTEDGAIIWDCTKLKIKNLGVIN